MQRPICSTIKKKGLRSRAWFKLNEIQKSDKLFRSGMTIVDLGSAPGGWSQFIANQISGEKRIIACDILPMDAITGVQFIQGDLRDPQVLQTLLKLVGEKKVQVVLSDMAPNMSGIPLVDTSNAIHLVELAIEICRDILSPGGTFLVKVFQGEEFDVCLHKIHALFMKIKIRKPHSSRTRSREIYVVATGRKI